MPPVPEQPAPQDSQTLSGFDAMEAALDNVMGMPYDGDEPAPEADQPEPVEPKAEVEAEVEAEPQGEVDQPEVEEQDVDENLDSDDDTDEDSDKEQPDPEVAEQPDTPNDDNLPSEDLVVASDGDTKVTLGELRESYSKAVTERENMQSEFTKKTQKLAEQAKVVTEQEERAVAHYQMVINNLGSGLKQLDDSTDWNALKQSDIATYNQRLQQRNQLEQNLHQFAGQAESLLADSKKAQAEREQSQKALAVEYLSTNINGWNPELYTKVKEFAEKSGVSSETFLSLRDGAAIKIFHDQMRLQEARNKALANVGKKLPRSPAKQKAVKRDTRTKQAKRIASLEKRVANGDREAGIELLMMSGRS